MLTILAFAVVIGIDNLQVAASIGVMDIQKSRKIVFKCLKANLDSAKIDQWSPRESIVITK